MKIFSIRVLFGTDLFEFYPINPVLKNLVGCSKKNNRKEIRIGINRCYKRKN